MPYFKTENGNAENIKYDNTKSVKEAIDDIKDTAMFIDSFDTDTGTLNTTSVSSSSISNPTAASVTFNNTNTGLAAANVQDAITEVNGKLSKEVFLASTQSVQYIDVNLDLSLYRSIRLEIANVTSGYNFILNNVTIDTERFMRDCNSETSFLGCYAYTTAPICGRAYYKGNNVISIYVNTSGFETKLYGIK